MMPIQLAPEPEEFHARVRVPGIRSLHEKCGLSVPAAYKRSKGKPFARDSISWNDASGIKHSRFVASFEELPASALAPTWQSAIDWLMGAYQQICAFSCFRIHSVTGTPSVDHMVPKSRKWDAVYEWSNYRLASLRMNARKRDLCNILDPFDVEPGWFELEFTFGQVRPGASVSGVPELRAKVQETIDTLGLNDFADERLRDIEAYDSGEVRLRRLWEESPFVASELVRQGRLHAYDIG